MLIYRKFKEFDKQFILDLRNLWNDEFGFIFPISEELFNRNTYLTEGFLEENSYVVLDDGFPIAFIINKNWPTTNIDGLYESTGWISLIYVSKQYRKNGIGSKLLEMSFEAFEALKIKKIYLGKDYQNFFPGLPKDLKENLDWFKHRGFEALYETNDLINLNISTDLLMKDSPFEYKLCTKELLPNLVQFMKNNFPGRWLKELNDYIKIGGNGNEYVICTDSSNMIYGFCRIGRFNTPIEKIAFSLTWRNRFEKLGGIGPLGVDSNFRRQHIAYNTIIKAMNILKEEGCKCLIIDWTNLLSFYRRFGFEIWKTYIYIEKNL